MNDLRTTEMTVNEIIQAHNQLGKFKIPLSGDTHRWDGESSLDGAMKGSFNGKGLPSHFILKFNK